MTRMTFKTAGTAALLALGLGTMGATAALAEQHMDAGDTAEVQAFQAATMSLADAVKAAETDTSGKAMSAEFETDDAATGMYHVEVAMTDGTTKTVAVNPADGTVTAVAMDAKDQNGEASDGDGETDDDNN
jgi:uncharacterized membrane protein YkoI